MNWQTSIYGIIYALSSGTMKYYTVMRLLYTGIAGAALTMIVDCLL